MRGLDVVRIYLLQAISFWEITLTTALERSDTDIVTSIRERQSSTNIDLSLLGKLLINGRSDIWLTEMKAKIALCVPPQLLGGLKKMVRLRNKLAHGKSVLDVKQDYTEVKNCFHDTLLLMSTFNNCFMEGTDLDDFKTQPFLLSNGKVLHSEQVVNVMIRSALSCLTQLQSSRMMFSQPEEFIGQEHLLEEIEQMLTPTANGTDENKCQRIVLHGPPGIGKTAIVRKLSSRLAGVFRKQYCFQASNEASLLVDISVFLSSEGFKGSRRKNFKDALQQCESCLFLIFEDVQNPEMIVALLPSDMHCVIFTSYSDLAWRELGLIPKKVKSIQVKSLTTSESLFLIRGILKKARKLDLFTSLTNGCHRKDIITFLEEGLQNLPLAVRLLAYQLIEETFTIKSLISLKPFLENREVGLPGKRSVPDQRAAGRVHIRGFFHLINSALESLPSNIQSSPLFFAFAILPFSLSLQFLEQLSSHLCLEEKEAGNVVKRLLQAGLIMLNIENRRDCHAPSHPALC